MRVIERTESRTIQALGDPAQAAAAIRSFIAQPSTRQLTATRRKAKRPYAARWRTSPPTTRCRSASSSAIPAIETVRGRLLRHRCRSALLQTRQRESAPERPPFIVDLVTPPYPQAQRAHRVTLVFDTPSYSAPPRASESAWLSVGPSEHRTGRSPFTRSLQVCRSRAAPIAKPLAAPAASPSTRRREVRVGTARSRRSYRRRHLQRLLRRVTRRVRVRHQGCSAHVAVAGSIWLFSGSCNGSACGNGRRRVVQYSARNGSPNASSCSCP